MIRRGSEGLSVAELLSVCLESGTFDECAVLSCTRLLTDFGGLDGLLLAPVCDLMHTNGLDAAKVASLKALHELSLRYSEGVMQTTPVFPGLQMNDANSVGRYLQRKLAGSTREVFACLFLDTHYRLIQFEVLSQGSINRAQVYPRELLRRSIELNAAAVVLSHNHPSGSAEPSLADIELTQNMLDLLRRVDVQVLDHIVVARGETVSLANRGLMTSQASWKRELP